MSGLDQTPQVNSTPNERGPIFFSLTVPGICFVLQTTQTTNFIQKSLPIYKNVLFHSSVNKVLLWEVTRGFKSNPYSTHCGYLAKWKLDTLGHEPPGHLSNN